MLEEIRGQLESLTFGQPNELAAFSLGFVPGGIALQGNSGLGDFEILPVAQADLIENELTLTEDVISTQHDYIADQFNISINQITEDLDGAIISTPLGEVNLFYQSNPENLGLSVVNAINNNQELTGFLSAELEESSGNVLIKSLENDFKFSTEITTDDLHNQLTATTLSPSTDSPAGVPLNSRIEVIAKESAPPLEVLITNAQSFETKRPKVKPILGRICDLKRTKIYFSADAAGNTTHFVVTSPIDIDPQQFLTGAFTPSDSQWEDYFKVFSPQLVDSADPTKLYRKKPPIRL